MLDFDNIDHWSPTFATGLGQFVQESVYTELRFQKPEFVEDARDLLLNKAGRDAVIDATLKLIRFEDIAGYHGSRLTDEEVVSIRSNGLRPLKAEDRRFRLTRALSQHAKWPEVAHRLEEVIQAHGRGGSAGRREDQVHLTLSRVGLTRRFNHYLTHGAEFDQHVAHALLGQEGVELLSGDGKPRVIRVSVPGASALDAAHPYFSISDLRDRGDVPNLVDEFLKAWSYRLGHPEFHLATLKADCGMVFQLTVPPAWIVGIDTLAE